MKRAFTSVNPHKAAWADNIPGRVVEEYAEQLKDVFANIFNSSLCQAVVPTSRKSATIISVPVKCFERLVLQHFKNHFPANLDPFQFVYRANRSTEEAISTVLHLTLSIVEERSVYARLLFINFSSAFNTITPQPLVEKLGLLLVDLGTCRWILNFLSQTADSQG